MDKSTIEQARNTNIAQYLIQKGELLKREGTRFRHEQHDSLVFYNNLFYWNSRDLKGNAIDFLMVYYGMDFMAAVRELTNESSNEQTVQSVNEFNFRNIKICSNLKRAIAYLNKTRLIDYNLIITLIKAKLIYLEDTTNNIIFPMKNLERDIVGIEYHGTLTEKRFKGISKKSAYGYGYNIIYGNPKNAIFFESAIDLISFIEIKKHENKRLKNIILVSMAGLKISVINTILRDFKIALNPILCVDNDTSGLNFVDKVSKIYPDTKAYYPQNGKDWNDQLRMLKLKETGRQEKK